MTEQRLTSLEKAASPTTPPEELQRLAQQYSKDREILQAIVTNPNVPSELLLQLGEHFSQEMLDNPVFELLLLENPNLLAEMSLNMVIKLLQLKEIPTFLKQGLLRHKERIHLAKNRSTPAPILEILAQDDDLEVRRQVASNANTPVSILEFLAHDVDEGVRSEVARNANTPVSILEILAHDVDEGVRSEVARNANTPVSILVEILAYDVDEGVRCEVANNANTPVSILEILAYDVDAVVRSGVTKNPNFRSFYLSENSIKK